MATLVTVASTKVQLDQTYILPAFLLSDEPVDEQDPSSLQADANNNGKCYLRVLRNFGGGAYLARVAPHPEQVEAAGYTLIVTDEQLAQVQLYQS